MIIYIHGFASSSNSNKVKLLSNSFEKVKSIDLSHRPSKAIQQLITLIEQQKNKRKILLVGSSLGGFYALYLSKMFDLSTVLVNPSMKPYETLKHHVGTEVINYSTGKSFLFKRNYLDELKEYEVNISDQNKLLLLLQTGDKTLDYKEALSMLSSAKTIVESGGTHQFDMFQNYFGHIRNFYSEQVGDSLEEDDGFKFSLTVAESKMVQKLAKKIGDSLNDTDHESLGEGISYVFEPFIIGTCITAKFYGHELKVRMGIENDCIV